MGFFPLLSNICMGDAASVTLTPPFNILITEEIIIKIFTCVMVNLFLF
jgi:hypothetical protein